MNSKRNLSIACAIATACLAGCGGSSGSGVRTGTLAGAPVSGLTYTTATQNGKTSAAGEFNYRDGETVTFSLGTVELGSVAATPRLDLPAIVGLDSLPATGPAFSDALYDPAGPTPLDRLVNIAVLFESLDADATPGNGIDIPAAVEQRVTPADIDLDMRYWEFQVGGNLRDGLGLPGLLRAAAAADELEARPPRDAGLAMQRIYAELSAPFESTFTARTTNDFDADGTVDNIRQLTWLPNGNVGVDDYDTNGDGVVDVRYNYTWDDNARQLGYTRDDDVDGVIDFTRTVEFDAFGATTLFQSLTGGGAISQRQVSQYDAAGKLLSLAFQTRTVDRVEYWIVDDDGLRSTYEFDADADGQIDQRARLYYPEGESRSDRWTLQERDVNMDGIVDIVTERAFDAQGRKTLQVTDNNGDGVPDYEERSIRDAQGRIVDYTRDDDGGGVDYAYRWTYAADGLSARRETDTDGDGVYERIQSQFFDADGNLLRNEYDNDGDGQVDTRDTYAYDAAGQRTERLRDTNGDGVIDQRYNYEYNADGVLVRQTFDRLDDGTLDSITEYSDFVSATVANYL